MGFDKKAIAIIPAAGSSNRMGLSQSKLLCEIAGKTVLQRTLESFDQSKLFDVILVPCREYDKESFSKLAKGLETPTEFFTGGECRQQSVKIALARINQLQESGLDLIVAVHDAARCFVSQKLIELSVAMARQVKAVSAAISCVDTVYEVDESGQIELPLLERSKLKSIQTPQVFEFPLLWKAHNLSFVNSSDDAGMVASIHPVSLIEGEISNFKITTAEDLKRAELLLVSKF